MTPPIPELEADFDRDMYFEILKEDPPFKRYVSRGDLPDTIDIPGPHEKADRAIFRAIRFTMKDGTPRLQPILGEAGMGKTHLYWVIKDQENYFAAGKFIAVYVPSPPSPVRVPLHFHACIVDEAGDALFEQAVDMLLEKFGGVRGSTSELYDYSYAVERLLVEYPGISSDVMKTLLRYRLDPANRDLARRWLLGDALSENEIEKLGIHTVLEEDDVTLATIKLLAEGSISPIVLFVDEMEGPMNTYGDEGERHFLEVLKRLYNESRNIVIIASALTDVWSRIYELADGPTRSRMERVVNLEPFTRDDVIEFVQKSMEEYWTAQNIDAPPDLLFPLTQSDIDEVFEKSEGNPREAIKLAISKVDDILHEKKEEEIIIQEDYVIKLTPAVLVGALVTALVDVGSKMGIDVAHGAFSDSSKQPSTMSILTKGEARKVLGIDIPNVKDWNRSGGVAAFYSAKRLDQAIDAKDADAAIMAIPEPTKGTKFEAVVKELGPALLTLKFNEETATDFVKRSTAGKLNPDIESILSEYLTNLFE
ncbi:MAG: ATP-binding protein [Candidatus Thorarchaeota archaeon]|nr:ATP-binding protein [Candidatus Thorarchaeota archaeon]